MQLQNGGQPLLGNDTFEWLTEKEREELRMLQVGHNLSSVLNNPNGQNEEESSWFSAFTPFTSLFDRDDLESTAPMPSVVPPVNLSDFDSYLAKNGTIVRKYLANHHIRVGVDGNTRKQKSVSHQQDSQSESVRRKQQLTESLAAAMSEQEIAKIEGDKAASLSSDALRVCFQQVPAKYFEESFSVSLDEENENSKHAAYLVQEKLCNWLDLVEVTLWSQTTSQADKFFNALSDLSVLNLHVSDTCATISKLRSHIQAVQEAVVKHHLAVLQRRRRKKNVEDVAALLTQIREVRETIPTVQRLLATSRDYGAAMQLLSQARQVVENELSNVHSLRTLSRQINEFEDMIVDQLSNKFVDLCVTLSEEESFEIDEEGSTEDGEMNGSFMGLQPGSNSLVVDLLPIVVGLLSAKSEPMKNVLAQYRTRIINEVRAAARNSVVEALSAVQSTEIGDEVPDDRNIGESSSIAATPSNQSLQSTLATLPPQAFLSFLALVFDSLEMVMRRSHRAHQAFVHCLTEVRQEENGIDQNSSEAFALVQKDTIDKLREESSEILGRVCELSQKSVQQLLTLRLAEHGRLQLADFKQLYDKVGTFSLKAEKLSSANKSIELKGTLRMSAKKFLTTTHERAMTALRAHLDEESWQSVEAPREMQAIVNRLISGRLSATRDLQPGDSNTANSTVAGQRKRTKFLVISDKSFKVVSAVLPFLDYLEQYLACAQQLSLSSTCLPSLLELLRLFNERSNKLVLQLEAMRTAGLKKITQKELALASQALSITIALIPTVEKILVGCLSTNSRHFEKDKGQIQSQLSEIEQRYSTHRDLIFDKFVEMIECLLNDCCGKRMPAIDWDSRAPSDIKPEQYILDLTKGIKTFHKSLAKNLPHDHLQLVFGRIFTLFNTRVPELYADVSPKTGVGMSQVRVDLRNLAHCLRMLAGTTGCGDVIDSFANARFSHSGVSNVTAVVEMPMPAREEEEETSD